MTIDVPLQPQEEAQLRAFADARGLSPELLVREALDWMLSGQPSELAAAADTTPETRSIAEVILDHMKDVPAEVMDAMPRDGASQHDHYIYGWPKREV